MLVEERRRRSDSIASDPVSPGGEAEPPSARLPSDEGLVVVAFEPGSRKDPAIVRSAGPGPVLVDRTVVVDQHGAVPPLVVAQEDMAEGQSGGGEQEVGRDASQRVALVGLDVDELRRGATGGAAATRHIRSAFAAKGALHLVHPRRELAGGHGGCVVGGVVGHGYPIVRRRGEDPPGESPTPGCTDGDVAGLRA